jgi:hypothetical protein
MEPTKITIKKMEKVMSELIKGSEEARGTFLYKGFRLQISKYKASGAERTSRLYHKRRKLGLCIRCGTKVTEKNPRTGKLYRLCAHHREIIDRKESGAKRPAAKVRKTSTAKKGAKKTQKAKKTTRKAAPRKRTAAKSTRKRRKS